MLAVLIVALIVVWAVVGMDWYVSGPPRETWWGALLEFAAAGPAVWALTVVALIDHFLIGEG